MKNLLQAFSSRPRMTCLAILAMLLAGILGYGQSADTTTSPTIAVTALDVTTGQQISNGETIKAGDQFQATVTVTDNIDCSGQFVVTALGAPGGPPEVLVQAMTFGIGPASGSNSVTGGVLTSNGTPGNPNRWKISASCDGALSGNAFGFGKFHFTSAVP